MSTARRQSRVLAMQALCVWDVQGIDSHNIIDTLAGDDTDHPEIASYARDLFKRFRDSHKEIDKIISKASTRWDIDRMSPVERNLMRVAVVELRTQEVPDRVTLNEAIEIAREFGGEESPRFVNGVLHTVLQQIIQNRPSSSHANTPSSATTQPKKETT